MFVVDSVRWVTDPDAVASEVDGLGGHKSGFGRSPGGSPKASAEDRAGWAGWGFAHWRNHEIAAGESN